jgi:hypothetical protein
MFCHGVGAIELCLNGNMTLDNLPKDVLKRPMLVFAPEGLKS